MNKNILLQNKYNLVFLIALLISIVVTLVAYKYLPDPFPIHFNRELKPDGFVRKPFGPFVLLITSVFLYILAWPLGMSLRAVQLGVLEPVVKIVHLAIGLLILGIHCAICIMLFR